MGQQDRLLELKRFSLGENKKSPEPSKVLGNIYVIYIVSNKDLYLLTEGDCYVRIKEKKGGKTLAEKKQYNVEVTRALASFPYFVLKKEITAGYNLYTRELLEIKQNYLDYKKGAEFYTEGSSGDYQPSNIRFKIAKTLIDKEARFMFSQTPDVTIQSVDTSEEQMKQVEQYQRLIDKVLKDKKNNFPKTLLQSAKDCFIGKRVACLIDFSEEDGIQTHFYNSLQFYYETEYGSDRLTKFISFENVNQTKSTQERLYLVNRYEEKDGTIYMSSILYNGTGKEQEIVIPEQAIQLDYIPAVVIINDGTLEDKRGVSEIESLTEYESGYSRLGNGDIDSERKGMNPIRYTVDMNSRTTKNLSSGAGAYWDLKSEQNQNEVHPMIGTLAPNMNHTEPVKVTLDRLKTTMYNEIDMPNISEETMAGTITSGKALKALYYPLQVRCDEKLKTWKPAIEFIAEAIIDLAVLNKVEVTSMYVLTSLDEVQYNIEVMENYALAEDEEEEKNSDLAEIAANARSRKSYIKKWRRSEFKTDAQIDEELMQIAVENNMMDSMSMNTQVQTELNKRGTSDKVDENIEMVQIEKVLEGTEGIKETKTEEEITE